jgi:hypothetical protein
LYRLCKQVIVKAGFQGPADSKPLNRSIPNFEQITTVLISCYEPTFTTITTRASSTQYGEVADLIGEKFFPGDKIPSPKFQRAFCMQIGKVELFNGEIKAKYSKIDLYQIGVRN